MLSEAQWRDLRQAIADYVQDAAAAPEGTIRHLWIVSPIPVVYLRFPVATTMLNLIPGVQAMEDDLLDQWEHGAHSGERARLLMTLLELRKKGNVQVTILSGDVHVASIGRLVSSLPDHVRAAEAEAIIMQVTSSAIVNRPPGRFELKAIEAIGLEGRGHVANGVFTELLEVDPGHGRIALRNFVTLAFDAPEASGGKGRLWADWIVEDGRKRKQLVIFP